MAEVIKLFGKCADGDGVPVPAVCSAASEACEEVVVIGYEKGSGDIYFATSFAEHAAERTLWIMDQAKRWLFEQVDAQ